VEVVAGGQVEMNFTMQVEATVPPLLWPPPLLRNRDVSFNADSVSQRGAVTRYRGNVEMRTDAVILHADELDLNLYTQRADVRGNVSVQVLPVGATVIPLAIK
jgi:lipopolysaccharide assembly outer membrane protein LptD (OstA)